MSPTIKKWSEDSIEAKAYRSVEQVPAVEDNDRNRLGYHVYLYLTNQYSTLDEAMHLAQARLLTSKDEARRIIADSLTREGLEVR